MNKLTISCGILVVLGSMFLLISTSALSATMQSSSYTITADVVSGGGEGLSSSTYRVKSTVGQPTPLMDQTAMPYSTSYYLYPGFWYTLEAGPFCVDMAAFAASFGFMEEDMNYNPVCDIDLDGDVDGIDIVDFIAGL